MANELQSLSDIFQNRLFRIPDYQRGYAWQQPQLVDFWDDLTNLQQDRFHYTGLLSLKPLKKEETVSWGEDRWLLQNGYKPFYIVDGQQRITTFVILLNEILHFVKGLKGNEEKPDKDIFLKYESLENITAKYISRKRPPKCMVITYLFGYEADNPSAAYMRYKIFDEPHAGTVYESYYTKNLKQAREFFADNIKALYEESDDGMKAVDFLYRKLTQQLMFNVHEIGDDYDVFVAFETMNNRGKKLTNLELLKNRLIYLTTLYDRAALDEQDKEHLRKTINSAWMEVYRQLGRNKNRPLSDDEFLRAHWIMYFGYSRQSGDAYIRFLLSKFSSKGIFEKEPVLLNTENEITEPDVTGETEDTDAIEEEADPEIVSKLRPKEIEEYVKSLKGLAKYWYYSYFPFESDELTDGEQKRIDRLNRIGIDYFRPLVTVLISRTDIPSFEKELVLEDIEKFIFMTFRLAVWQSTYGSSFYYRTAHKLLTGDITAGEIHDELEERMTKDRDSVIQNFITRMDRLFKSGKGYYGWDIRYYFFFEYEMSLREKYGVDKFCNWAIFSKSDKDKISIEHILPQTPTKLYWKNQFRMYTDEEIKTLSGALGNLLPLSQSINSALQNDGFKEKKHTKKNGRRGYENGSHSENEVAKLQNWTADEIYERSGKLLDFMQERWGFTLAKEQKESLIHLPFVNDGRKVPDEITEEDILEDDSDDQTPKDIRSERQKEFWTGFVKYATAKGRDTDIAKQNPYGRAYYDIHIGADDFQLFFAIPFGKTIRLGIYTYSPDTFGRLQSKKEILETKFGDNLIWDSSKDSATHKSIRYSRDADVFGTDNRDALYEWFIDAFDRIMAALKAAGESF
ncbi:MAG TPA: DUF4268 domain-containing protein [Lachnospiraceae bacterium]|nr:DUF4268 domain-containing protein [Lachnospiraceae bacterium]